MSTLSLHRTRVALDSYDADGPRRAAVWEDALTDEDVRAAEVEERKAADLVREAFALDTAHINNRGQAFAVNPGDTWLRDQVAKYGYPE